LLSNEKGLADKVKLPGPFDFRLAQAAVPGGIYSRIPAARTALGAGYFFAGLAISSLQRCSHHPDVLSGGQAFIM
jgi:hypothetical protein